MLGYVIHHIRARDYLAEDAARCRDEQDRSYRFQRIFGNRVELFDFACALHLQNREDRADRECDDRCAEEFQKVRECAAHLGHRDDRRERHQDDRNDNRCQCGEAGRKFAVFSDQFLIGFGQFGLGGFVFCLNCFADFISPQISRDQRENRTESAKPHQQQKIVADAERGRRGNRARRRRDEHMGNVKTGSKSSVRSTGGRCTEAMPLR